VSSRPCQQLAEDLFRIDEVTSACRCDAGIQRGVQASALLGLEVVVLDDDEFDLGPIG
jgi:hypothetical protein